MTFRSKRSLAAVVGMAWLLVAAPSPAEVATGWQEPPIPGTSADAVTLGRDLDGDGDPDEVNRAGT